MITDQSLAKGTKLRILRETPYRGQKFVVPAEVRWSAVLEGNKFRVGCSLERRLTYTEMQSFA
jgi:hypothetical protein